MSEHGDTQAQAALQQAELLAVQSREDEAIALIETQLALAPDHPDLLQTLGWLLIGVHRDAEAIRVLEGLIGLDPQHESASYLLSFAYGNVGDHERAEEHIVSCLSADPQSALYHFQYARVLTVGVDSGRRVSRRAKKLALSHVETGLGLAPDESDSYREAARVYFRLKQPTEALRFTEQGLALAPEDPDLLNLHADLTTANAQPTSRYDTITQSATQVAQMSKLLANFPQHTQARRVLFHELWWQRALLIDAPLILLSIVALTIGATFRASGSVTAIVTGTIVTAIFGIIRLVTYAVVCGKAVPGFRRLLFRALPASRLVRVLIITSWNTIGLAALAMIFVRDAIAIRWLIVVVGIGVVAALVASIAWQLQFWSGATRVGGFSADPDSLSRLRDHRSQLNTRIFYRILGAGVLALCTFAAVTGRDDAVAIVWLGCGSLVLSPIIGVLAVRRAERGLLDELPEATTLARNYRAPRLVTGALLAAVGVLALGLTVSGISQLPVLPNAHDADGSYTLGSSASSASTSASGTDACRGRPAARLACMIERNKERQQGWQMPEVTVPDFQVPDFEVSQLDLPDVGEWADEG